MSTPRANHSLRPSSADTLPYESESDEEYIDADEWFAWFKTTEEYKLMSAPVQSAMVLPVAQNTTTNEL